MTERHAMPSNKLIIVMVGLPARGKSYITKKLARYLNWLQLETTIFNVGERRRATACDCLEDESKTHATAPATSTAQHSADFFDPSNKRAVSQRDEIALSTLRELLDHLQVGNSRVAIFDATNSTVQRRNSILDTISQQKEEAPDVLFLESRCFDETLLEHNMRLKLKGPDYEKVDPALALVDFRNRVKMYETSYESLGDYEESLGVSYLKLIDVGRKLVAFNINGFLAAQTIEFLVNFHLSERQIWITRNGESEDDCVRRIGRHSPLSTTGQQYAQSMTKFILHQLSIWEKDKGTVPQDRKQKLNIWTSMMTQAIQTAQHFTTAQYMVKNSPLLNDLHAGKMTGMTFEEINQQYPREMADRKAAPVSYRWPGPGGEAHLDMIYRLRAVILELERSKDHILLITHRAVMRVLLTYFEGLSRDNIANVDVPLNTLYLVEPHPYGVSVKTFQFCADSQWFYEKKQ
ncbi:6-phosphofructo-2-kinase [Exophiala xenobiotica]|uniref:6-phosphofructo-2-kinase n=1 Tax=Lithohypha guttulata TaxID=1690604 RepID=A0ABR0K360_9EURO|nr:6-phosphofructo-2-kinase [Lithohypha guttulata]KAK5313593.1 6-phosphofructo-2-kinase [Exophiala xenobiotica]